MPEIHWIDGFPTSFVAPGGRPPDGEVERIVSHNPKTKATLHVHAGAVASRAKSLLIARRNSNDTVQRAQIVWETPDEADALLDHRIHLAVDASIPPEGMEDDEWLKKSNSAATRAARAIEYGHIGKGGVGGSLAKFQQKGRRYPGKWILHDAAGLRGSGKGVR
jgi:hypothetical protein